ncbi:hypothetical protein [Pseudomonas moraviensis]|uniref:hypothetical protein n=1 Tax=Pseudomonas moraviensis TaxID=321662 RepID=UPI001580EBD8|nr:hypothetical protein [Pseudomonas moraviensis]
MSTGDEHISQPVPAPIIAYPAEASTTGPATLLLGSGIPDALVQVWNIENTDLLGAGQISANGRWAFSINGVQAQGQQKIHAHQTYAGTTSEWSDERGYEVRLRPEIDVPVVVEPIEGAQVDTPLMFSGDVTRAKGFVSIFDLDTGLEIARAAVESDRKWQTPAAHSLAVGQYRISAVTTSPARFQIGAVCGHLPWSQKRAKACSTSLACAPSFKTRCGKFPLSGADLPPLDWSVRTHPSKHWRRAPVCR